MTVKNSASHLSPSPEADLRNEQIQEEESVAGLFDNRPADSPQQSNLILKAIASLKSAYRDAAQVCQGAMTWVKNQLGLAEADPVIEISKPRNFSKKPLPQEFQDEINNHRNGQAAKLAEQKFITSADTPAQESGPVPLEAGEESFNAYLRLCKQSNVKPGELDCPQNFLEDAVIYAQSFVQKVSDRQTIAREKNSEFWLNPDDQERLEAANHFLDVHVKHKRSDELEQPRPIQTNSQAQHNSFLEWQVWRKDPTQLPSDPEFSTDAALAYANVLLQKYAGKDLAKNNEIRELLNSAYDLIAHPESRAELDAELMNALLEQDISTLRTSRGEGSQPQSEVANTEKENISPQGPPPMPSPRLRSEPSFLPAEWRNIPAFETLDEDLKVQSSVLLNGFLNEFSDQVSKGAPDFSKHPDTFIELGASAAVDFMKRVLASDDDVATVPPITYAAANHLINEHLRRKSSRGGPRA